MCECVCVYCLRLTCSSNQVNARLFLNCVSQPKAQLVSKVQAQFSMTPSVPLPSCSLKQTPILLEEQLLREQIQSLSFMSFEYFESSHIAAFFRALYEDQGFSVSPLGICTYKPDQYPFQVTSWPVSWSDCFWCCMLGVLEQFGNKLRMKKSCCWQGKRQVLLLTPTLKKPLLVPTGNGWL